MKRSPALFALLVLALPAWAEVPCGPEGVTASVSPEIAPQGQPIQVTLTNDSSQTITLPSSCVYQSVFGAGFLYAPYCLAIVWPIPPGRSESMPWDQRDGNGEQAPTGSYFVSIVHHDGSCLLTVTITEGIPALDRWGLSALVGVLCLAGIWALRARPAPPGSAQ
jgi:hypothetical protein